MSWWENYFGSEDYLRLEGSPREEIVERCARFICEALDIGPGSRVLDVGCGVGRMAVALASRGCLVTGIDSSPYMVERCHDLAIAEPRFTVQKVDFRQIPFVEAFDAVLCWGNTLGYGTRDDDAVALMSIVRALIPGGVILIDLHNRAWYRHNAVGTGWRETDTDFVLWEMTYDDADRKLLSRDIIVPKCSGAPREYTASYLHYEPLEIVRLLEHTGLSEIQLYGDACASDDGPLFSPEGYNERSHVMIVTGKKARDRRIESP